MKNSMMRGWFIAILMVLNGVVAFAATPWTVNPRDYRYDMSLYFDVQAGSSNMDYSRYEVGVFFGEECRGIAERLPLDNGKECLYARVRSNTDSGETMTFKAYDNETGEIRAICGASFQFESDGMLGYPSAPYIVKETLAFDVKISAGSGGSVDQIGGRIAEGTVLTVTATPDEGHHFEKWSDESTENPRTLIVTSDIDLTAEFAVNSYKLTYMLDGEIFKELSVEYGAAITPEAEPTKEGHTFTGWIGLPESMPAHDVIVTGSFSVNSYQATFVIDGETIETRLIEFGAVVTTPDAPAKEGHTFAGWQGVPETMPAHDITIIGSYTVNTYTLTYMVDGEVYAEYTVEYGAAITPEADPAKEGHTFSGWNSVPETMPAHDVTVTGSFSVNSYTLTYLLDGEVYRTSQVAYGAALTAEADPTKEGHTFSGWQGLPQTMPAHDVTVTGTFSVNSYMLTYMVDGEVYAEHMVEFGAAITPEPDPVREGYTFSGWDNVPEKMPARDVTVNGSFSNTVFKATFVIDGETIETRLIEFGAVVTTPDAPAKEGHTFRGWQDVPNTMPAHDITITGSYTVNTYTLTYLLDGEVYSTSQVAYGTALTAEADPTKEGHTFSGWTGLPETMPAHDVIVTGSFSVNIYQVTFVIDGETIETRLFEYGAEVTTPEAPAKEGHTFSGWEDVPDTMPAHDITIFGSYIVNLYKLTLFLNGEVYLIETLEYGEEIVLPVPDVPEGMIFDGWQEDVPETMPACDVDVYGTYSPYNSVEMTVAEPGDRVVVHTLMGQKLFEGEWNEALTLLAPGLYIVNGRKVII